MTDKLIVIAVLATDISAATVDGAKGGHADFWTINGVQHSVGDHVGVVVHTTMDTSYPTPAIALRCVISAIKHDGQGVPKISVRPADVHSRVLELEGGRQDFMLHLNDKLVVIKHQVKTVSPEFVEAATLQAGIEPVIDYERGMLFEEAVRKSTHVSATGEVTHGHAITIQGITLCGGDELEYSADYGVNWELRRITAVGSKNNKFFVKTIAADAPIPLNKDIMKTEEIPDHYLIRGSQEDRIARAETMRQRGLMTGVELPQFLNDSNTKPVVEETAETSLSNQETIVLTQLEKGEQLESVVNTTANSGRNPREVMVIQGMLHVVGDSIEVSYDREVWVKVRILGMSFKDTKYILSVRDELATVSIRDGDLSAEFYVRAIQEARARRATAKQIESVPAGEGAVAYATDSGLFTHTTKEEVVKTDYQQMLDHGMPFGGRLYTKAEAETLLHGPKSVFSVYGFLVEPNNHIEISSDRKSWIDVKVVKVASNGEFGHIVKAATESGSEFFIEPNVYVRPPVQFRQEMLAARNAAQQTCAITQSRAYQEIASGILVDELIPPSALTVHLGMMSFSFFGLEHHVGEYVEVFWLRAGPGAEGGTWMEQQISSIKPLMDPPRWDITVRVNDENNTKHQLLQTSRIRLTAARRGHAERELVRQDHDYRAHTAHLNARPQWATAVSAAKTAFTGQHSRAFGDQPGKIGRDWHAPAPVAKPVGDTRELYPFAPRHLYGYTQLPFPNTREHADTYQGASADELTSQAILKRVHDDFAARPGSRDRLSIPGDMNHFLESHGFRQVPPYTSKDLMEATGMAGLALSSMVREDILLGDFRKAIKQFATGVETLVLGRPGRGFE